MDLAGKPLRILFSRHPMLDQLRIAGYGRQRRFQLMGNIGSKLLAHLRVL